MTSHEPHQLDENQGKWHEPSHALKGAQLVDAPTEVNIQFKEQGWMRLFLDHRIFPSTKTEGGPRWPENGWTRALNTYRGPAGA